MDYILHLDHYLTVLLPLLGNWVYGLVGVVIFLESACILTPFLPGDGLIFALGLLAGKGLLSTRYIITIVFSMTVLGYLLNYLLGSYLGKKMMPLINRWQLEQHLEKARHYFKIHGVNSILIGRFLPILRTFLPFVSGIVHMNFFLFCLANVAGALLWIFVLSSFGWFVAKVPVFEKYGSTFILGIMFISLLPIMITVAKNLLRKVKWSV